MRNVYLVTLFVCVLGVSILGFRGTTFTAPPIDLQLQSSTPRWRPLREYTSTSPCSESQV